MFGKKNSSNQKFVLNFKKIFSYLLLSTLVLFLFSSKSFALERDAIIVLPEKVRSDQEATRSIVTAESQQASASAESSKKEDLTEPTSEVKGKLERYMSEHPAQPLTVTNFLEHAVRMAVKKGVPANTIVLILLFPLVAAIIAGSRHIVGIKGFGIFLPAVLSVVFVSTGIIDGMLLFITVMAVATGGRMALKKIKLQYLPRMALVLWFVSLGVFGVLFLSPIFNLEELMNVSIFSILILILMTEDFIRIQIGRSMQQAIRRMIETLIIAIICSLVLQVDFLQKFVLLNPEIVVLSVAVLDIYMGKYTGLRLLEYKKFKEILK